MRCLIVDDEPPAREGMHKLLAVHPEVTSISEASTVTEACRRIESLAVDLIFLDIQLRGETGFELLARLKEPRPLVVFVTAFDRYAVRAFRHDAVDYLLKPVEPQALADALARAKRRRPDTVSPTLAHPAALQALGLTAREAEVLFWLAHGKSNPEIAGILHNAPGTVKKQVQSILTRLGVTSRVGAALVAARILGLPRP